ncbi:MAG: hypothetical protein V4557_03170 [Bacteroidota bacterium]
MIPANTIRIFFSRILLLIVYGIFFTVQLTAYFDHRTRTTYRLNSEVFHGVKTVNHLTDGLTNSDAAGKKLTIRLNKKFYPQSTVLYAIFASRTPAFFFTKQLTYTCIHPFVDDVFLSDHSLRGPPVYA